MNKLFIALIVVFGAGIGFLGWKLLGPDSSEAVEQSSSRPTQKKAPGGSLFLDSTETPSTTTSRREPVIEDSEFSLRPPVEFSDNIQSNLAALNVLFSRGEDERYLKELERLIQQNPTVPDYPAAKADYYTSQRNYPETEKAIKQLLAVQPNNIMATASLGEVMAFQGRNDEALVQLEKAIQMKPDYRSALESYVGVSAAAGKGDQAHEKLESLFQQNPSNGTIGAVLAQSYTMKGDTAKAKEIANKVYAADPSNGDAAREVARLELDSGNIEKGGELAEQAYRKSNDFGTRRDSLSLAITAAIQSKNKARGQWALNEMKAMKLDSDFIALHQDLLDQSLNEKK